MHVLGRPLTTHVCVYGGLCSKRHCLHCAAARSEMILPGGSRSSTWTPWLLHGHHGPARPHLPPRRRHRSPPPMVAVQGAASARPSGMHHVTTTAVHASQAMATAVVAGAEAAASHPPCPPSACVQTRRRRRCRRGPRLPWSWPSRRRRRHRLSPLAPRLPCRHPSPPLPPLPTPTPIRAHRWRRCQCASAGPWRSRTWLCPSSSCG
jgi:hypothetical protein